MRRFLGFGVVAALLVAPSWEISARSGILGLRKVSTTSICANSQCPPPVSPGSTTFSTPTTTTFLVPAYNTLTIEMWAGGASGAGNVPGSSNVASNGGTASTITSPSLTVAGAVGGSVGGSAQPGGVTPTGFGTNTPGIASASAAAVPSAGANGPAPTSAAGGVASTGGGNCTGGTGSNPSAGGGGSYNSGSGSPGYAGGGSGSYGSITYTRGVGAAPAIGATLNITIGAGGALTGGSCRGGKGGDGQIKFTWSFLLDAANDNRPMFLSAAA